MKKPTHKIYRTTNWSAYNRALMSRGNIAIWFDPATQWYAPSKGKQGRNQTYLNLKSSVLKFSHFLLAVSGLIY